MTLLLSKRARIHVALSLPLVFLSMACSEPMSPEASVDSFTSSVVAKAISEADTIPVDRHVVVCKIGPAGTYSFNIEQSVPADGFAGTIQVSDPFDLDADNCVDTFLSSDQLINDGQPQVTVTVTEIGLPDDVVLDSVRVIQEGQAPVKGTGPDASALVNFFHGAVIIFYNRFVPPPPPVCVGLTPGYWKNWENHYTSEEFQELIDALPDPYNGYTADELVDILSYGGPNPVSKLEKFYVANLLTIALTGTELPNPSGGALHPDCSHGDIEGTLGEALEAAAAILADPGEYRRNEINAIKDILDAFANLGDEPEEV